MLLKSLVFVYINNIYSSRKIKEAVSSKIEEQKAALEQLQSENNILSNDKK